MRKGLICLGQINGSQYCAGRAAKTVTFRDFIYQRRRETVLELLLLQKFLPITRKGAIRGPD